MVLRELIDYFYSTFRWKKFESFSSMLSNAITVLDWISSSSLKAAAHDSLYFNFAIILKLLKLIILPDYFSCEAGQIIKNVASGMTSVIFWQWMDSFTARERLRGTSRTARWSGRARPTRWKASGWVQESGRTCPHNTPLNCPPHFTVCTHAQVP